MLQAVKANKVYDVTEEQADRYAAEGFDIYDGKRIVKHSANKTVPWAKYDEALMEIDRLKKQVADLKKQPTRSTRSKRAE